MKKYFLFIFFILLLAEKADCAFEVKNNGARSAGLGGCFTGLAEGNEAIYYNPAGLAKIEQKQIGSSFVRLFNLEELTLQTLDFIYPLKNKSVGMTIQQFGNSQYQENVFYLATGVEITNFFWVGANLKIMNLGIKDYGKKNFLGLDFSFLLELFPGIQLGGMFHNFNQPSFKEIPLNKDDTLNIGIAFTGKDKNTLFEFNRNQEGNIDWSIGQEIIFGEILSLRYGLSPAKEIISGGIGIDLGYFIINYAWIYHFFLSSQHIFSLSFNW